MYLGTASRKHKDGPVVEYYALAHNGRYPETGKPVARIIHSPGRADHLVRLCQSIARFCGPQVIDPVSNTDDGKVDSAPGLAENLKLIRSITRNRPGYRSIVGRRLSQVRSCERRRLGSSGGCSSGCNPRRITSTQLGISRQHHRCRHSGESSV